jgi:intron-binding protein aquarius
LCVGLRKHDVAFLLTVRPSRPIGTRYDPNLPFIPQVGLVYVRGCEIEGMLDENGKVIEEGNFCSLLLFYNSFIETNEKM